MNANLKKIAAVLLCLCLLVGLGACRKNEEPSPDAIDQIEGIIAGAWEEAGSPVVTEELQAKLNKALEGLTGAGHENNYVIVTLYKALDGSAEITDVAKMPAQEW
ncbi:MAG: hypothetical protein IJK10_06040 [Firmicutes bacterium]|nr:hypothetical protein [Bacillota bacterium]